MRIRLTSGRTPQTCTSVMNTSAQPRLGQPDVRVADDMQLLQHAVEQPAVGVEDPPPQHAADHGGKRPRQDQDRQHDAASAEDPMQRHGDDQAERELERHRQRHVADRVRDGFACGRGPEYVAVVAEADEARLPADSRVRRIRGLSGSP